VSNGFIFICGKTTAGTCFKNNLMGAPAQMIDVVRRVQRGDYVFLWHREERRLFGPWRAIARGEWNELLGESFDPERRERFPAVVRCERVGGYTRNYEYHAGLAQEVVERALGRTIEKYPPAQLSYDQTSRLLVALADSMEVRTHTPPDPEHSRRAEDGHWVRSDAEARIDDWLYRNNVRHEYEPAVPVSGAAMYGDWYLPESRVYVEYLGRMDSQKYADRTAEKRRRYAAVGLRVVELTPKHLEFLDELLRKELRAAGVQLKD